MDLHKPKPWHGGAEFLKEIGTIVIGVLIALGGEQAVEWLHIQHQIADAREALHKEISNDATLAVDGLEENRCTLALLDRFAGWAKGGPKPDMSHAQMILGTAGTTVWDVVKNGAVARLPLKEQLAYASFYGRVGNYNSNMEQQRMDGQKLSAYVSLDRLSPAQATALLETINATRPRPRVQLGNGAALIEDARAVGAGPRPLSAEERRRLEAFCAVAGAAPPQWPAGS